MSLSLKRILKPLEPFKNQTLVMKGLGDKVRGDGDNHMRGMGCLLTGIELFPGNIQGGSHTPAGWSSGIPLTRKLRTSCSPSPIRGRDSVRWNSESWCLIERILGREWFTRLPILQ